jgi:uncharacterized membrane protein
LSDVSRPEPPAPQGTGSRRLKYALIASLALNLLVVGTVAGAMYTFHRHPPPRMGYGPHQDFGLMGLTRWLPEDRRKEMRRKLREDRERLRPLVDELRAARRDAATKLAAEPFDSAALKAAFDVAGEKDRTVRDAAVTAFLAHAEQLKPEERRKLADWWLKRNEPFKERLRKKKKDAAEAKDASPPPAN